MQVAAEDQAYVHNCATMAQVHLTPQEERLLSLYCYGFPIPQAARHAGMAPDRARELINDPRLTATLDQIKETYADAVKISRETVTVMLLEAHRKAATASEEIAAAKEIGKLHGLYKSDDQKGTKITNNTQINGDVKVNTRKRLARMDTDELIKLAQLGDPE